jgi:hypothetical protein
MRVHWIRALFLARKRHFKNQSILKFFGVPPIGAPALLKNTYQDAADIRFKLEGSVTPRPTEERVIFEVEDQNIALLGYNNQMAKYNASRYPEMHRFAAMHPRMLHMRRKAFKKGFKDMEKSITALIEDTDYSGLSMELADVPLTEVARWIKHL